MESLEAHNRYIDAEALNVNKRSGRAEFKFENTYREPETCIGVK